MSEPIKNRKMTLRELLEEVIADDEIELETRDRAIAVADKLPKDKK